MCVIGKILSDKNVDIIDFVSKIYNVNEIDKTIPTLIVGWDNVKRIYGDNISILNKQISENVFWTFSKTEKRIDYENDLLKFYSFIINKLNKDIKYSYFNILTSTFSKKKSFINFIKNNEQKIIYLKDNFIYIYFKKTVIGISLMDIEYFGIKKEKVLNEIKSNHNNIILYNNDFLSFRMKTFITNNNILVPYLYYIKNQ